MELQEQDSKAFEEIVSILQCHPEIEKFELAKEPILSLPGLEIYPSKRKVFRDRQEIQLTTKEYEILLLLVTHKGYVLTYNQIYEKVWGNYPSGSENNTIGFHICNLREKRDTHLLRDLFPRNCNLRPFFPDFLTLGFYSVCK